MAEWEMINENHYGNLSCRLDRIKVEEGHVYRHMTSIEGIGITHPQVTLCFVEQKKGD